MSGKMEAEAPTQVIWKNCLSIDIPQANILQFWTLLKQDNAELIKLACLGMDFAIFTSESNKIRSFGALI